MRPGPYGLLLASVLASRRRPGRGCRRATCSRSSSACCSAPRSLLAVRVARVTPRLMRLAVALALAGVAVNLLESLGGVVGEGEVRGDERARWCCSARRRSRSALVRTLRVSREVRLEAVSGVLSLYILLGLLFAFLFGAVDRLGGGPFFAGGEPATVSQLPVLQLHDADHRRLRRLRRPHRPRPHAVRLRDADRPDLPGHGGVADRQQPPPAARGARPALRTASARTTTTGQGACSSSAFDVDPSSFDLIAPRPREPTTIAHAERSSATADDRVGDPAAVGLGVRLGGGAELAREACAGLGRRGGAVVLHLVEQRDLLRASATGSPPCRTGRTRAPSRRRGRAPTR